jgi:hypothetical protein
MLNKIKDTFIKASLYIRRKKASLISYPAQKIRMTPNLNRPVVLNTINHSGLISPKAFKTIYYTPVNIHIINITCIKSFHTKVKASSRIGPHNKDVLSLVIGSLLGDSYANARSIEGTRFCYRQSIVDKDYLF